MARTTTDLFRDAGLSAQGPVRWGDPLPSHRSGVYVVTGPADLLNAPLSELAIKAWLERVPGLRVDGGLADAKALGMRLDALWIQREPVLYIGRAGSDLAARVRAYYRTPLGDPRPHAGGHWLKTLSILQNLSVWWAETDDPVGAEAALLEAFAERHDVGMLPFANRQDAYGVRKPHGITGSTLPRNVQNAGAVTKRRPPGSAPQSARQTRSIHAINAALERIACAAPIREVTAVDAAAELDRLGLLRDSADRPGLPLRRLLREGRIANARQDSGRWWFIECPDR